MGRILLGAVGVLVLQALFVVGYLALYTPDPLVENGVRKVLICGDKRDRSARMWEIADSGTWGVDYRAWDTPREGDCRLWRHYAPGGPVED